jgi:hypothetical protein
VGDGFRIPDLLPLQRIAAPMLIVSALDDGFDTHRRPGMPLGGSPARSWSSSTPEGISWSGMGRRCGQWCGSFLTMLLPARTSDQKKNRKVMPKSIYVNVRCETDSLMPDNESAA